MKNSLLLSIFLIFCTGCASISDNINTPDDLNGNSNNENSIADDISSDNNFDSTNANSSDLNIKFRTQDIYFDVDQYKVKESENVKIAFNTKLLSSSDLKDKRVVIEGNCDEWGSDEYNYALGLKRARSVKKELIIQGIDKNRLSLISYGEGNFVCEEKTKDCWSANRRVEFNLK